LIIIIRKFRMIYEGLLILKTDVMMLKIHITGINYILKHKRYSNIKLL